VAITGQHLRRLYVRAAISGTVSPGLTASDARRLLRAWDRQQEEFNRLREARFTFMLDVLEAHLPGRFRAMDLGSGPGSLSDRLLRRFPQARCVAIDRDPVGLQIGAAAIGTHRGRLTWLDADLGAPGWDRGLGRVRYDAALSTTALHWLRPARLRLLYRNLYRRMRPGAVLLNGDHLPWPERNRELTSLAEEVRRLTLGSAGGRRPWRKGWEAWWRSAERTPGLEAAFAERRRRFSSTHPHVKEVDVEFHLRALRDAGFRDPSVAWQRFENRVVVAIR
jgi:SAM-dependent methyltransferase